MSYIAEYVIGWRFNGLHNGKTMADLSQTVCVRSNNEAFKWTNTNTTQNIHKHIHTHTPTNAIGENAMRYATLRLKPCYRPTPLNISWRKVVHLHSRHPLKLWRLVSSVRPVSDAYRPEGSSALSTGIFYLENEGQGR